MKKTLLIAYIALYTQLIFSPIVASCLNTLDNFDPKSLDDDRNTSKKIQPASLLVEDKRHELIRINHYNDTCGHDFFLFLHFTKTIHREQLKHKKQLEERIEQLQKKIDGPKKVKKRLQAIRQKLRTQKINEQRNATNKAIQQNSSKFNNLVIPEKKTASEINAERREYNKRLMAYYKAIDHNK